MPESLSKIWKKYGFEIAIMLSIFSILILALINRGKKGTWSKPVFLNLSKGKKTKKIVRESKGEIECRRVLEDIYKVPFNKIRPDFLRNPVTKDFNLELDCYNDDLKIAVEYNGKQHYVFVPFMHGNKQAFMNQKYRDHIKRELCEKNGVHLIEVPYTVQVQDIRAFLEKKLPDK